MKKRIAMLVLGLALSLTVVNINSIQVHAITQDEMLQMMIDHGSDIDSLTGTGGVHPELYNGDTTGTESNTEAASTPQPAKAVSLETEQKKTITKTETTKDNTCTHDYTETITKEPTCTEDGVKNYTCSKCGNSYTAPIQALGHTEGDWEVTKAPNCTDKGQKVQKCTVCGEVLNTEDIDTIEHTVGNWEVKTKSTLTHKGIEIQKCTVCGAILNEREIPINMTAWYIIIGVAAVIIGVLTFVVISIRHKNKALLRKHK